mmetsp:Transcript_59254/g.166825  ORF Transcript_59254/g.166825 Transcript_59254/m.166825 type:complete len:203 (+) Transcript_59254:167-775(+)
MSRRPCSSSSRSNLLRQGVGRERSASSRCPSQWRTSTSWGGTFSSRASATWRRGSFSRGPRTAAPSTPCSGSWPSSCPSPVPCASFWRQHSGHRPRQSGATSVTASACCARSCGSRSTSGPSPCCSTPSRKATSGVSPTPETPWQAGPWSARSSDLTTASSRPSAGYSVPRSSPRRSGTSGSSSAASARTSPAAASWASSRC